MSLKSADYSLRSVTRDDFEFLYALKVATFKKYVAATWGTWDELWQRRRFAEQFSCANQQIIMVEERDVGVLVVDWSTDPVFLGNIALQPAYQRQGLGSKIVGDVLGPDRGGHARTRSWAPCSDQIVGAVLLSDPTGS